MEHRAMFRLLKSKLYHTCPFQFKVHPEPPTKHDALDRHVDFGFLEKHKCCTWFGCCEKIRKMNMFIDNLEQDTAALACMRDPANAAQTSTCSLSDSVELVLVSHSVELSDSVELVSFLARRWAPLLWHWPYLGQCLKHRLHLQPSQPLVQSSQEAWEVYFLKKSVAGAGSQMVRWEWPIFPVRLSTHRSPCGSDMSANLSLSVLKQPNSTFSIHSLDTGSSNVKVLSHNISPPVSQPMARFRKTWNNGPLIVLPW